MPGLEGEAVTPPRITTERARKYIVSVNDPGSFYSMLAADLVDARERIAELEATILNERGGGNPPSAGWSPVVGSDYQLMWCKDVPGRGCAIVRRVLPCGWRYDFSMESGPPVQATPAREAMRAADAARVPA